jgi:hypothetical protein
MRCNKFAYVLAATILCACWRDTDRSSTLTPPIPVTIRTVAALPHEPLGALVQHDALGPSQIRVRYVSADLSDGDFTPWQSSDSSATTPIASANTLRSAPNLVNRPARAGHPPSRAKRSARRRCVGSGHFRCDRSPQAIFHLQHARSCTSWWRRCSTLLARVRER